MKFLIIILLISSLFFNMNIFQSLKSFLGNIVRPVQQQVTPRNIINTISSFFKPRPQPKPGKIPSNISVPFPVPTPAPAQFKSNLLVPPSQQGEQRKIYEQAQKQFGGQPLEKITSRTNPPLVQTTGGTTQPTGTTGGTTGGQINYGGQPPTGTTPISGEVTGETLADNSMQTAAENFAKTIFGLDTQGLLNLGDPFALDELLANNAAIRAIAPGYAQDWDRFSQSMKNEVRSGQTTTARNLQGLQQGGENYQTKLSRLLQLGQQQTGEQFAGRGLYESGQRQRAQGLQNVTAQQDLQGYLQGQQRQVQGVKQQEEDLLNRLAFRQQEEQKRQYQAQQSDVESAVQEAQRVAQTRQGILALEGRPLTNELLPDYFKKRGETLRSFLPTNYG